MPMTAGASNPQARLKRYGCDGRRPGVPVSDLVRRRIPSGRRSRRGVRARARLQQLGRGFLQGRAGSTFRRVDGSASRTWTTRSRSCAAPRRCRASAAPSSGPMFIEGHYFTHPYYDPLWAELESLGTTARGASHCRVCGIPSGPRTDRSLEKVKGRLNQHSGIMNAGGGPFAGGGGYLDVRILLRFAPVRTSDLADSVLLARQSHVRRVRR